MEEGVQEQIAVLTKVWAMHATEEALPALRALILVLSLLSIFTGGRAHSMGSASNPSLQKYILVGLFGSAWNFGQLGADISRYRRMAKPHHEDKQE